MLVVAPTPFFGDRGCHIRIYEEVRGLAGQDIDCQIVTYPTGRDLPGMRIVRARALPGVQARALGPSVARPALDCALLQAASRAARQFAPHLLHVHLHEGVAIGAALRVRHPVPLIADLQGSLTGELVDHGFLGGRGPFTAAVRRIEAWLARRADRTLASSSHVASLLVQQGVPAERIEVFPDGVDLAACQPRVPDPALVAHLGLEMKRVIVFLGVLTRYQGVDVLLDAAPAVVRAFPDAHFLVMGYPNEAHYRAQVHARGLDGAVTLPGRIPYAEAARWLTLGEVAVSAKLSASEANGKLLTYMACGLPVVASDTAINREVLAEHGAYAPIGDVDALAARIVALLSDPERARAAGRALRRRAERYYAWPSLAARLVTIYHRALGAARPGSHGPLTPDHP